MILCHNKQRYILNELYCDAGVAKALNAQFLIVWPRLTFAGAKQWLLSLFAFPELCRLFARVNICSWMMNTISHRVSGSTIHTHTQAPAFGEPRNTRRQTHFPTFRALCSNGSK